MIKFCSMRVSSREIVKKKGKKKPDFCLWRNDSILYALLVLINNLAGPVCMNISIVILEKLRALLTL